MLTHRHLVRIAQSRGYVVRDGKDGHGAAMGAILEAASVLSLASAPRDDQSNVATTEVKLTDDMKMNNADYATALTVAWLSNTSTRASAADVPAFLQSMFQALEGLGASNAAAAPAEPAAEHTPKVSVRKSLASPDNIISMIDGKPYKTLKRHLATNGLTPAEYRERYNLKADYPMVAPSYATARSDMAKKIGLGRKKADGAPPAAEKPARKPRKAAASE